MKTWNKCLLASIGALMPLIMSLYFAEFEVLKQNFTTTIFIGYLIKVIILVTIGGLIGYFYRSETSGMKLFQLGIAAPAIMLGLINEQRLGSSEGREANPNTTALFSLNIPTNYFVKGNLNGQQDTTIRFHEAQILQYDYPEESAKEELFRGFKGKKITNIWFLMYDSYSDLKEARITIVDLQNLYPDLGIQLYQSVQDPEKYDVIVGAHLEYTEGLKLQEKYSILMDKYLVLWEYNPTYFK